MEHIRSLAELQDELPPILVHRTTMRVIDGMHRLKAAILRGERTIEATFYDGDDAEAFVRQYPDQWFMFRPMWPAASAEPARYALSRQA